jgi:hypothetical protein
VSICRKNRCASGFRAKEGVCTGGCPFRRAHNDVDDPHTAGESGAERTLGERSGARTLETAHTRPPDNLTEFILAQFFPYRYPASRDPHSEAQHSAKVGTRVDTDDHRTRTNFHTRRETLSSLSSLSPVSECVVVSRDLLLRPSPRNLNEDAVAREHVAVCEVRWARELGYGRRRTAVTACKGSRARRVSVDMFARRGNGRRVGTYGDELFWSVHAVLLLVLVRHTASVMPCSSQHQLLQLLQLHVAGGGLAAGSGWPCCTAMLRRCEWTDGRQPGRTSGRSVSPCGSGPFRDVTPRERAASRRHVSARGFWFTPLG